jgi:hypothetical protein
MEIDMTPEAKARRAREKHLNKLTSIAHLVTVLPLHPARSGDWLSMETAAGATICGPVKAFNEIMEMMGFRPVRITSNILNSESKRFCIDINTPSYCDPGCESYHSA